MALNALNVLVGYTGEVFFAAVNTGSPVTMPTDATTALPAAFNGFGYCTEDGIQESPSESWTDIRAWQKGQTVRKIRSQEQWTWDFATLETNQQGLAAYYGNYAVGGVKIGGQAATRGHWVIEVVDNKDKLRIVIPDGEVTGRGTHSYKTDEGISYPLTLSAYPYTAAPTSGANAIVYRGVLP
jgi:hypothetical protein